MNGLPDLLAPVVGIGVSTRQSVQIAVERDIPLSEINMLRQPKAIRRQDGIHQVRMKGVAGFDPAGMATLRRNRL
ncbi:hypothetical protein D3C80_1964330 [compost metagenome]